MKLDEGQLNFFDLLNEYEDDQGAHVRVRKPVAKRTKKDEAPSMQVKEGIPNPKAIETLEKPAPVKKSSKEPPEKIVICKVEAEPADKTPVKKKAVEKKTVPIKEEPIKEVSSAIEELPAVEKTATKEMPKAAPTKVTLEQLFKQCKKCWCFDCKHNSRNEGVPRDLCGNMMPCPACKGCIDEDMATVCEIGNAKEGCRLRATEEGLVSTEEDFE